MRVQGGGVVSVDICPPTTASRQEEQRIPKFEERVTLLFDELRKPVFRYLLSLGVNSSDADEIIQETFLQLFRHLRAGGSDDNLRGWIFRVAHNSAINELKRHKFVAGVTPERWAQLAGSSVTREPNPEELLVRKEKMARVHAAIATLSEQQTMCLSLRAEGFRYREVAEILGVTVSTVAESLRRAIKKLSKEPHV